MPSKMAENQFIAIGPHRMGEDGDIGIIMVQGVLEAEHLSMMQPRSVAMYRRHGYVLTVIDARNATAMTPEARRVGAELNRKTPMVSASAIYGASLLTRTLATLLWRAVALLPPGHAELTFCKTEAEARAWLDLRRPKLRALAAGMKSRK